MTETLKIYVDLDGCLFDFAKGVIKLLPSFIEGVTERDSKLDRQMWKAISKHQKAGGRFWYELPLMQDALSLWEFVKPYQPEVLTAAGNPSFGAAEQKIESVTKHFGPDVKVHIVQRSIDKADYATATSLLIDDKLKCVEPFRQAGGHAILHTNALDTIEQLKEILNLT